MSLLDTFMDNFIVSLATGTLGIGSLVGWAIRAVSPKRIEERHQQRLDSLDANFSRSAEINDYPGMAKVSKQREKLIKRWSRNTDRPELRLFGRAYVFVGSFLLTVGGLIQVTVFDEMSGWLGAILGVAFIAFGNVSIDLLMDRHEKGISDADRKMIAKRCEQIGIATPDFPAPLAAIDKRGGGDDDSADTQTATLDEGGPDADQDS